MLLQIDARRDAATAIPGRAHIVIAVAEDGRLHLQSFFQGRVDSSYAGRADDAVLLQELPVLIAELRGQIADAQSD